MATYILDKESAVQFKLDQHLYNVIIRISSPSEELPHLRFENIYRDILVLRFYDLEEERNGLRIFSEHDLKNTLKFFEMHRNCDNMVIHCEKGVSRSVGVAVGWFFFIDNRTSLYKIYHGNKYRPNRHIVEMFAKALNWNLKYINKWEKERYKNLTLTIR